jgi:5-oxoprolinase (ATP-hydrolysing)
MTTLWNIWIDRGGTFTDVVGRHPDGAIVSHKLLSENPERYDDAALHGIREIMGLDEATPLEKAPIDQIKMGTTVATNALLERAGDRTLLAITKGFGDALRIGYQNRPDLFKLHIELPELLHEAVVEVDERLSADGEIITPLEEEGVRRDLEYHFARGIRGLAIVFMHGYRYPEHEKRVADIARRIGFTQISMSHVVSPLMKLVGRGDTTVVDAYLSPILRRYVERVAARLGSGAATGPRLMFMQSSGGLTDAGRFQGKDAILSGPAGGVVGMVKTGEAAGFTRLIGFDMGGTSTDVAHYDGTYERSFETQVAGVRMRAPMMRIHTVAAGGGSIVQFDGARFRVGPGSAGANPGPLCYRRGGPLTVTDCNVMLGKIQPEFFPHIFGLGGDQPLDYPAVADAFADLASEIGAAVASEPTVAAVAEGFLRIAVENMAHAIKKISVQRGHDVTAYTLNCFGGAGGQHACLVADALGMRTILIHPLAGVLSAYGIGLADVSAMRQFQVETDLDDESLAAAADRCLAVERQAQAEVAEQGIAADEVKVVRTVHLRYSGTDTALPVEWADGAAMREEFEILHRQRFGFIAPERSLVIESVSIEAIGTSEVIAEKSAVTTPALSPATPIAHRQVYMAGAFNATPFFHCHDLTIDHPVVGPAVILDTIGTIVVEPGWQALRHQAGHILLTRHQPRAYTEAIGTTVDPVMLEVFNNLFMSIAEQMGVSLANTAYSVNIKERLDFSCALFNSHGDLVANAPHVPVHLGSMSESVRTIIRENEGRIRPGSVYMLNAPYNGGTHLPDVTVVTPVFDEHCEDIIFYLGSRGHHADIGGRTPGSCPPDSTHIEEEGVLIDNFLLVEHGRLREAEVRALLSSGPFPCRNIEQNLADLTAQIAANETGAHELRKMVAQFGLATVHAYMEHVQDNGEESVRRVLDVLHDGEFCNELDNGKQIRVRITVDKIKREALLDFSGTSPQDGGNFNAPVAVCRAAVLYVFRTLVDDDIPLNEGCLKPLKVHVPEGTILNPRYPAAVIAGNTEVSQAVCDTLYGALGRLAASQGTMNNFVFGNEYYQNYETICGGTGAGPAHPGASGVHSHMTNTRMTDAEVIEHRFPVRIESFRLRTGSGGAGKFRGGEGVVREMRFLQPMEATILSSRRLTQPFGLGGGRSGASGRNYVIRVNGEVIELGGNDEITMEAGDLFVIKTPGGGGFGDD